MCGEIIAWKEEITCGEFHQPQCPQVCEKGPNPLAGDKAESVSSVDRSVDTPRRQGQQSSCARHLEARHYDFHLLVCRYSPHRASRPPL